jgi:hypothetical protein
MLSVSRWSNAPLQVSKASSIEDVNGFLGASYGLPLFNDGLLLRIILELLGLILGLKN